MDLVILAALAIFIFVKLNKKLGEFDDDQKRESIKNFLKEKANYQQKRSKKHKIRDSNIIELNPEALNEKLKDDTSQEDQDIFDKIDPNIADQVKIILQKSNITASVFIDGAKRAFEMINENFSEQNLSQVKNIISDKIYQQFQKNIDDLKNKGQKLNSKIISINDAKIIDAKIESNFSYLTIEFLSEQIDYITENSKVIKGSKSELVNIVDKWVFKKDLNSKNPVWLLSRVF